MINHTFAPWRAARQTVLLPALGAFLLIGGATAVAAVETVELVNFVMCDGGSNDVLGSDSVYGFAIDNDTAYVQLSGASLPQITRIDNLSGGQATTRLVSPAQWLATAGKTSMTTMNGMGVWSNVVEFADISSDEIWRVNKLTGELIKYADITSITNVTGSTNGVNILAWHTVNPLTGEDVFYDSQSKNILATGGSNVVSIFMTAAEITNAFGNADIYGGMTFDTSGNFYWGQYVSGSYEGLQRRATNGVLSLLVNKQDIANVTSGSYPVIGAMLYAPDGLLYFVTRTGTRSCILTCDPAASNVAATLKLHLSESDLTNSAARSANVGGEIGWYKGGFCWHHFKEGTWRSGVFAVVPSNQPALAISGPAEVAINTSNVPYACTLLLTNRWGVYFRYDQTGTSQWSIIGGAPAGVTLDGNLLSVDAEPTNQLITLQAASSYAGQPLTNTYAVLLVPEPAMLALGLLLLCAGSVRSVRSV